MRKRNEALNKVMSAAPAGAPAGRRLPGEPTKPPVTHPTLCVPVQAGGMAVGSTAHAGAPSKLLDSHHHRNDFASSGHGQRR